MATLGDDDGGEADRTAELYGSAVAEGVWRQCGAGSIGELGQMVPLREAAGTFAG